MSFPFMDLVKSYYYYYYYYYYYCCNIFLYMYVITASLNYLAVEILINYSVLSHFTAE